MSAGSQGVTIPSIAVAALTQCMWRRSQLQTQSCSVILVVPALPCTALPSKIHPSAKEVGANNDSRFSSRPLRVAHRLYIERHFDIHSVLLHVTIGNTDDGTDHSSC